MGTITTEDRSQAEAMFGPYGAKTEVERDVILMTVIFDRLKDETRLKQGKKRRGRSGRTWPMFLRAGGILAAVERLMLKREASSGFAVVVDAGYKDFSYEAVVLAHPELFSEKAKAKAQARMNPPR